MSNGVQVVGDHTEEFRRKFIETSHAKEVREHLADHVLRTHWTLKLFWYLGARLGTAYARCLQVSPQYAVAVLQRRSGQLSHEKLKRRQPYLVTAFDPTFLSFTHR